MSLIRRTQIENILGAISTNNSTSTPLTSGGVFTGEAEDVSGYKAIGIIVATSHDSATDGLRAEFSSDGTNWDHIYNYTISAKTDGDAPFYQVSIAARYFRLRYINGSNNLSYLRIQTIFHPTAVVSETTRVVDDINPQSNVVLNKSVISGENIDGTFHNVGVNSSNRLKVSTLDTDEGNEFTFIQTQPFYPGVPVKVLMYVPSGSNYRYHLSQELTISESFLVMSWEGCEYSNPGLDVSTYLINRDRNYTDDVDIKIFTYPTITASGGYLYSFYKENGGQFTISIANKPGEMILKDGETYLIKVVNKSLNITYMSTIMDLRRQLK